MFICVWVAFDPEDPDYTHDIGMLRLLRIMEPKDDLYDELIIDGVIGLASFWADGADGVLPCAPQREPLFCSVWPTKGKQWIKYSPRRTHTQLSPT